MGTMIVTLCVVAIAVAWYWRRRGWRRKPLARGSRHPYACVSIQFEEDACAAVKALAGMRFLCRMAPLVPLEECDCVMCLCRYQHHSDRRHHDRRDIYTRPGTVEFTERRINRADRRRNALRA